MDSVIRGNSITREAHFFLDGDLADPSLPRVTIRNPLGVAVVTDATPTRISQGIYQYEFATALDTPIGTWSDEWQGTISAQALGPISGYFSVLPVGAIAPVPSASYTYDIGTTVGLLRLLIQDHDMSSVSTSLPLEQRSAVFTDEELGAILGLRSNDVFMAAATALRIWATNKNLIIIARRIGKTDIDYGSIRADLMKAADAYETQAREQPADAIAEVAWNDFVTRDLYIAESLRALN